MASNPETLLPLFSGLQTLPGIGPKTAQNMAALGIEKPRDLLFNLPHSVIDRRPVKTVKGVELPATLTVEVTATRHRAPSRKGAPHRIFVEDAETVFQIVYFSASGRYIESLLPVGGRRVVSGKFELFDGEANLVHPDYVVAPQEAAEIPEFEAVYPLTAGVTQKVLAKGISAALSRVPDMPEWADAELVKREGWPTTAEALALAHTPQHLGDVSPVAKARMRLAYDELLAHQMTLALARARVRRAKEIGRASCRERV